MPTIQSTPTPAGTELRCLDAGVPLPVLGWAIAGHPGAALCERFVLDGCAVEDDDVLLVEHSAIARLSAAKAAQLDLPPATSLRATIAGAGVIVQPSFNISLRWTRPDGQPVAGVARVGAWLGEAAGWRRLPETLFTVAEAVEAHREADNDAAKLAAVAALRRALPQAATEGLAKASGLLGTVTIVEADALSLDALGEGNDLRIVPVLHRAGDPDHMPLLAAEGQRQFGEVQFHRWTAARSVYALPGAVYVTVSPPLRRALDVVHAARGLSLAERRAFLREPRPAIRAAIGEDEAAATVIEALVIETPGWSERVIGLGLWQPRVLPWIALGGSDWFGGDSGTAPRGITVADRSLRLEPEAAAALATKVEAAMASGQPDVTTDTPDGPLTVPATDDTLKALAALQPRPAAERPGFVIIRSNEETQDIEALVQARAAPPPGIPRCLHTALKPHQVEGLTWLQRNWIAGSPGVLLADDMGLGKTLQGLAFLAWLREGMQAGLIQRRPLLIVAPTGLLRNWEAEHAQHLDPPRLGEPLHAHGAGLGPLRLRGGNGRIDQNVLQAADWVLTTFQTLRDYIADFAGVQFAAVLMDEAQAVKTPAIRTTDAAKAVKADFRVALTGTPVENRLADLWCIVDCVAPGHLGDLRRFSRLYEGENRAQHLPELKRSLDRPLGGRPALMLRRLKEDKLPELPERTDVVREAVMEGEQLAAYRDALDAGRGASAGQVLKALQRLRSASLHAGLHPDLGDTALLAGSARLRVATDILDGLAQQGERALVFVESLDLMALLTGFLQRRYRMAAPPSTISGKISGSARFDRVQRFQSGPPGFDVMLISPRAGGVGLTLTRATHVLHLTRWWNPAVEDQCTARVLRIGQTRPVTVHLMLATLPDGAPSFDQTLHALLARKRVLMRDVLAPAEASDEELASMLKDVTRA